MNRFRTIRRVVNIVLVVGLLLFATRTAFAQDAVQPAVNALDTVWVLFCAFLVFFMQAGFGFLEAGFVRSKNVVNILAENVMDTTMATVAFIFVGFGLMFGAGNSFFGTEWFALRGIPEIYPGLTIPTLAVASIWIETPLKLGLGPTQIVLLAITVVVAVLTVVPGRATRLQASVHLTLFAAFLFLAMSP